MLNQPDQRVLTVNGTYFRFPRSDVSRTPTKIQVRIVFDSDSANEPTLFDQQMNLLSHILPDGRRLEIRPLSQADVETIVRIRGE